VPRSSPEEVFAEARSAIVHGDWESFFACLDRNDLLRICDNSFKAMLHNPAATDDFDRLCQAHGIATAQLEEARGLIDAYVEMAKAMTGPSAGSTPPEERHRLSQNHRDTVRRSGKHIKSVLRSTRDLAAFTACLERLMRSTTRGGSVSSTLFVDEVLEHVEVDGKKAWARRRISDGHSEDIAFIRRKEGWTIRLFARSPKTR
jgi:hypothetical protein